MREGACEGPAERNHTGFFTPGINTHFLVIVGEKKKRGFIVDYWSSRALLLLDYKIK